MKKWLVFLLGIISGIVLTLAFALFINGSNDSEIGLEMFEEPGENMGYSSFTIIQVLESGAALAKADSSFDSIVLIIPDKTQQFYDNQEIILRNDQCAQRVGTYRYSTRLESGKTVPAIKIIECKESQNLIDNDTVTNKYNSGKIIFDKPGDIVSRKNFEVQKVLDSGDAIALEISQIIMGNVVTSDLEVLILAQAKVLISIIIK